MQDMAESRKVGDVTSPAEPGFSLFSIVAQSRAFVLLFALFLNILVSGFDWQWDLLPFLLRTFIVLAAIYMTADNKQHLIIGLFLGVPSLLLLFLTRGDQFEVLDWITYAVVLCLYLFIIRLMLGQIFNARTITIDTIGMALCTYIMIGSTWVLFYTPVLAFDAAAFSQPIGIAEGDAMHTLTYYSFVTLTTLGYGDISPVSKIARSLSIMEALTGTLFLAVLISRLVGSYRSRKDL
jgi:hypothetical protein